MDRNDAYYEKLMKSGATFLSRWKGADANVRELTVSHKTLVIRLSREGSAGNLFLACIEPEWMLGPFYWENSEIEIQLSRTDDKQDAKIKVVDRPNKFELICGAIEFKENVKSV